MFNISTELKKISDFYFGKIFPKIDESDTRQLEAFYFAINLIVPDKIFKDELNKLLQKGFSDLESEYYLSCIFKVDRNIIKFKIEEFNHDRKK